MATVSEMGVAITGDPTGLQKALDEAKRMLDQLKDSVANTSKGVSGLGQAVDKLGEPIKTTSAVFKQLTDAIAQVSPEAARMTRSVISGLESMGVATTLAAAGIIAVGVAIAKTAYDAAVEFDAAFDKIRVSTGATGEKLAALQESFRTLFTTLPTTSQAAAEAISFLNARLGLTGKGLEELATQELELARITGAALGPQLEATTKVFSKWQISTENQSSALDYLFKISQQTAVGVTDLSRSLVQSAGPLKELGFSFEQAAVLVGKFTAAGFDVGKMTMGLKQALAEMAKEGVTNASEAFTILVERIKAMQDPMAQLDYANKVFGKRMGEDMVQAIRAGLIPGLDDAKKKIDESTETVAKAVEQTDDWQEAWIRLRNKVTEEIEPLGKVIFDGLTAIVTTFTGSEAEINKRWGQLWTDLTVSSKEGADSMLEAIVNQFLFGEDAMQAAGRRLGEALIKGIDNFIKGLAGIEVPVQISNPIAKAREKINWPEEQTKWGGEGWKVGQKLGQGIKDGHDSVVFHSPYFALSALNTAIAQMLEIAQHGREVGIELGRSLQEGFTSTALAEDAAKTATFFLNEALNQLKEILLDLPVPVLNLKRSVEAATDGIIEQNRVLIDGKRYWDDWSRTLGIIPPKVKDVGDAATTAASAAKHGASGINDAFRSISEFADKYLPKTVAMVIDLAGTIIKVLGDLGVKLPGILGDIFNKTTSGSGSTSATKAGSVLGGKFVEAFSLALQGAQGILSASGAPNRVAGAISGGISGAVSGAMIGSMFAPGIGTAIGAVVGGIAGIFGGLWRSPLQKAQEAAALQEAKDAIKLSMDRVLKSAQEVIQSSIESFNKALVFFENLDEFTAPRKEKFAEFWRAMTRLLNGFFEQAKLFAGQSLTELKAVAETLLPIVQAIAALPAAFDAINKHFGVAQSAIDRFFADFDKIMTAFFARADVWVEGVSKRAKKVAQRLAPAVALIADFGTALTNIKDIKEPPDEVFDIFDRVIDKILVHVTNLNLRFEKDVLKAMANFSEKAGFALTLWKTAIDSITGMVNIQMPSDQDFANIFNAIEKIVAGMTAMAAKLETESLGKAEAIANSSLALFASIKAGVEALTALKDFQGVLPETFQTFLDDFNAAITMLEAMAQRAIQFDVVSAVFKNYIASGAASLNQAFVMLSQIMNAAGSFFPGGSPAVVVGGDVTSASLPSTVGTTSTSTMGSTSRSAPTGPSAPTGSISLTLQLSGADPRAAAVIAFIEQTFGAGVLSGTSSQFA